MEVTMGRGSGNAIKEFLRNKNRKVNCHGTMITLPERFTWILFRHGDKTNQSPTRGGELTPLGRKQVWDTTWQLIEYFGQEDMNNAIFLASPAYRILQSIHITFSAIGLNPNGPPPYPNSFKIVKRLEWGPNDGHANDAFAIEKLIAYTTDNIVVAMGHNGLWEYAAEIIHPQEERYSLPAGATFIITENGIEMITPCVTA